MAVLLCQDLSASAARFCQRRCAVSGGSGGARPRGAGPGRRPARRRRPGRVPGGQERRRARSRVHHAGGREPGAAPARSQRKIMAPRRLPPVSSQLATPGSRWAHHGPEDPVSSRTAWWPLRLDWCRRSRWSPTSGCRWTRSSRGPRAGVTSMRSASSSASSHEPHTLTFSAAAAHVGERRRAPGRRSPPGPARPPRRPARSATLASHESAQGPQLAGHPGGRQGSAGPAGGRGRRTGTRSPARPASSVSQS